MALEINHKEVLTPPVPAATVVLLRDTPIVILDEFSSALDGKMEASLVNGLQRALAGRTLLLITHRTSPLGLVERVINLPSFANNDAGR